MEHTTITLTGDGLQELQALDIQINVAATINVSPQAARRRVTGWVASEVGNMLMGERPQLVVGKLTVWRVPIVLGSSTLGVLGEVGTVDVDAETGEILLAETLSQEILQNAKTLSRSALQTNP